VVGLRRRVRGGARVSLCDCCADAFRDFASQRSLAVENFADSCGMETDSGGDLIEPATLAVDLNPERLGHRSHIVLHRGSMTSRVTDGVARVLAGILTGCRDLFPAAGYFFIPR
jgi:hypothetical protein